MIQIWKNRIVPETENVVAFPGGDFAGRTDGGKTRVHLELAFKSIEEALSWLKANGIPTAALERHRPDGGA